jgi:hypothetical protein
VPVAARPAASKRPRVNLHPSPYSVPPASSLVRDRSDSHCRPTDNIKASARLERFWRTLKEGAGLYRLHLPLTSEDLEQRLELTLVHYLCFRPHEGLKGAVPAEAFLRLESAHLKAVEPLRGRPGEGPTAVPESDSPTPIAPLLQVVIA